MVCASRNTFKRIYIYIYVFKMFLAGNDSCSLRLEFDITELNSFE